MKEKKNKNKNEVLNEEITVTTSTEPVVTQPAAAIDEVEKAKIELEKAKKEYEEALTVRIRLEEEFKALFGKNNCAADNAHRYVAPIAIKYERDEIPPKVKDAFADVLTETEGSVAETDEVTETENAAIDNEENAVEVNEAVEEVAATVEETPAEEVAETVEETPAEEVADTVEEAPTEEVAETVEKTPAEEVADTVEEAPTEEVAETIEEAPAEEVTETVEETPAEDVTKTVEETPAEEVAETVEEAPAEEVVIIEEKKAYVKPEATNEEDEKKAAYAGKWNIEQKDSDYTAYLYSADGGKILATHVYTSLSGVKSAITTIRNNILAGNVTITIDRNGKFRFKVFSASNKVLCLSEQSNTRFQCDKSLEAAKRFSASAIIIQL